MVAWRGAFFLRKPGWIDRLPESARPHSPSSVSKYSIRDRAGIRPLHVRKSIM